MRYFFLSALLTLSTFSSPAQLLGGSASMGFLRLPPGAASTALGGYAIVSEGNDLSVAFQNSALLESASQTRWHSSFQMLPGGSKGYFLSVSSSKPQAPFASAISVFYLDHGSVPATDAGGNLLGSFRPREWTLQYAVSRSYQTRWRAGASVQFANSSFAQYRSSAFLGNVGLRYRDTAGGLELGATLRNLGFFVRRYAGGTREQLPVELSFALWKRWKDSPFAMGMLLQRMQRWQLDSDRLYDASLSPLGVDTRRSTFVGQFFNHLILSARVDLHARVRFLAGYNFLRRRELSWAGGRNGLTGFSVGCRLQLEKWQLVYGRSYYQPGRALDQLSMEMNLRPLSKGWKR